MQWDMKECFRYGGSDRHKWGLLVRRTTMEVAVSLRQVEALVPQPEKSFPLKGLHAGAIRSGGELWALEQNVVLFLLIAVQDARAIQDLQEAVTATRTQVLQQLRRSCEQRRRRAQLLLKEIEARLATSR